MRKNSASTVTIARTLGGLTAKTVGRKLKELGLDGNYKWPDDKIKILRNGYKEGETPSQIAKTLGTGYTSKSVTTKASELGVSSRSDWNEEEEALFEMLHSIGLPQKDILHHMSHMPEGQVRYRIGRKREEFSALSFDQRIALRAECNVQVTKLIGRNYKDIGIRNAAWIAAVAPHTGRDMRELGQVCMLPIVYVERVFARLDLENIWPVTQRHIPSLGDHDFRRIADICGEEIALLREMIKYGATSS